MIPVHPSFAPSLLFSETAAVQADAAQNFLKLAQEHLDDPETATTYLISLFSVPLDAIREVSPLYELLLTLLPTLIQRNHWLSHLQLFLNQTPNERQGQEQLARKLAAYFREKIRPTDLSTYATALYYSAQTLALSQSREDHRATSALLFQAIQSLFQERLEAIRNGGETEAFLNYLRNIPRWKEFGCQKADIKTLCDRALTLIHNIPQKARAPYLSFLPLIGEILHQPFTPPAQYVTERYRAELHKLRQSYRDLTSNPFLCWKQFLNDVLLRDAFAILGPPPCGYDLRAIGSLGKQEPCPYSDLEYFILVEKDPPGSSRYRNYFQRLQELLQLQILSLGETEQTNVAIFTALGPPRSGLHVDAGSAENTIQLPEKLAHIVSEKQRFFRSSFQNIALHSTSLSQIQTSPDLFERYAKAMPQGDWHLFRALTRIQANIAHYDTEWRTPFSPELKEVDLKAQFIALLHYLLSDLALFENMVSPATPQIIQELLQRQRITPDTAALLWEATQAIYRIRCRLHLEYQQQKDSAFLTGNALQGCLSFSEQNVLQKAYFLILQPLYLHLLHPLRLAEQLEKKFQEELLGANIPSLENLQQIHKAVVETTAELRQKTKLTAEDLRETLSQLQKFYQDCKANLSLQKAASPEQRETLAQTKAAVNALFTFCSIEHLKQLSTIDLLQSGWNLHFAHPDILSPAAPSFLTQLISHLGPEGPHLHYYQALSKATAWEPFREHYIATLQAQGWAHLATQLQHLPNVDGYRQSMRLHQRAFEAMLFAATDPDPQPCQHIASVRIIAPSFQGQSRFLRSQAIAPLLDERGHLKKMPGSAHSVASAREEGRYQLHFKEEPTHPMLEFAVYNLAFRTVGRVAPETELVRFEVAIAGKTEVYPVLISQTILGLTLKEVALPPDLAPEAWKQWTRLILSAMLTRPGDGRRSNYVLDPQLFLFSVDNDHSFAEPVVRNNLFSSKVNFSSAVFCLYPSKPLHPEVLDEFCQLHVELLLETWLEELIRQEQQYLSLFSPAERQKLYAKEPHRFRAQLLLRPRTLETLTYQFWWLQNRLRQRQKDPTALELLQEIISLRTGTFVEKPIGATYLFPRYQKAIATKTTLEEQLKEATGWKQDQSMTSLQADEAVLGTTLSFAQIENDTSPYRPLQAKKELFKAILHPIYNASYVNPQALDINLEKLVRGESPDLERQRLVLRLLSQTLATTPQKPTSIALQHCAALDSLEGLLHPQLTHLFLHQCPQVQDQHFRQLATAAPQLQSLRLKGCNGLQMIRGLWFNRSLHFPRLQQLTIEDCPNLQALVRIDAPRLKTLKLLSNPELRTVEVYGHYFIPQMIFEGCTFDVEETKMEIVANAFIFGAADWKEYLGEVGVEPPLPSDIFEILEAPCPFFPDKQVRQTHLLTLIPQTVNGKPLTLKTLGELVQEPREGYATRYRYLDLGQYTDPPAPASHWALFRTGVIVKSVDQNYSAQQQIVQQYPGYVVPTILDATVSILLKYLKTGTRLYKKKPWYPYTRCQEKYDQNCQLGVGGFEPDGLFVGNHCSDALNLVGVAGLRKF